MKYAEIVEEITDQNYFRFNNRLYKPPKGLVMGLPIPPILAETFMNDFENKMFKGNRFGSMIKHWTRFVDDILVVWPGTDRQVHLFLKETNAMHKDIKFTVEKRNKPINYLDLTLTVHSKGIDCKIYGKSA